MPSRPYAADDFDAIRARLEELQKQKSAPAAPETKSTNYDFTYFHNGIRWIMRPITDRAKRGSIQIKRAADRSLSGTDSDAAVKRWLASNQYTFKQVSNEDQV